MSYREKRSQRGFTLIELLLVVVIIGIMLAVIVPRAWRANVDAKYGMVRQAATELASVGVQWAENQLQGQDIQGSEAQLADYLAYITGGDATGASDSLTVDQTANQWVADTAALGWQSVTTMTGRDVGGTGNDVAPSEAAREMMAKDRRATNPFNGQDVFNPSNNPEGAGTVVPGAIASGYTIDDELRQGDGSQWYYYALRFQGTDNEGFNLANLAANTFHADMANTGLNGLRAGIFMARALKTTTAAVN